MMPQSPTRAGGPAVLLPGVRPDGLDSCEPSAKRKRDQEHRSAARKPKRKKKQKMAQLEDSEADETFDLKAGVNTAIGKMNSSLLADYVARRTKRFGPDLSLVELEDRHIPGTHGIYMSARLHPFSIRS